MRKYLSPKEVEEIYGVPEKTLANWRSNGKGPAYFKYGARIRYLSDDLERWVETHRVLTVDMPKEKTIRT